VVAASRVEALRSSQRIRHAGLEVGEPEAILLVPRYLLRQLTQDGLRIAQGRCAVLMVQ
jgi:hypothetical protein